MYPLAIALFGALDTEAVSLDEIKEWADRQLLERDAPPRNWLFELSISSTISEAAEALMREMRGRLHLPDNISNLLIGLLYLRYRRGEIPKERLVVDVGDVLDAYGGSLMDVEAWVSQTEREASMSNATHALLEELSAQAEAVLTRLLATRSAATDEFWSTTHA
jgi:hypothetical protein